LHPHSLLGLQVLVVLIPISLSRRITIACDDFKASASAILVQDLLSLSDAYEWYLRQTKTGYRRGLAIT